jgi:hypothetical protein
MSETEHHLEHAEHAHHAAHDPFDRRVTMTIAIIAAMLACVTMLSHRAHNTTLQLHIEANDKYTLASDQWNLFQAKKNRQYVYEAFADQASVATKERSADLDSQIKIWRDKVNKYEKENEPIYKEAKDFEKEAADRKKEAEHMHHIGDQYDLGELGVEFGLVLCSVAVLTKRNGFWFTGMGAALIGGTVAGIGLIQQYVVH